MALILVVENEQLIRWSVARRLEGLGHRVLLAHDLAEARAHLGRERPDLVLLDLTLPDGHGLELLEHAPGLARASPVLVVTAVEDQADQNRAAHLGAVAYLTKPVDHDSLTHLVASHLGRG